MVSISYVQLSTFLQYMMVTKMSNESLQKTGFKMWCIHLQPENLQDVTNWKFVG
jgi:hypothetical protein